MLGVNSFESPHRGDSNEYTEHTHIEDWKSIPKLSHFPNDLAPWFTLSGSNNPCLKQISMVPKIFKPLKFGSTFIVFTLNTRTNQARSYSVDQIWHHFNIRSHYENMPIQIYRQFHLKKTENFQIKNSDIFHISAQNIDCGYSLEPPRRGGSNEYPQSMFLSRNKENNVYPCKPQFYYIKVGFKGVKII